MITEQVVIKTDVCVCVCLRTKVCIPFLIHLISSNRPQGRGMNVVFDLLLFPPYLSLLPFPLSSLVCRNKSFFSGQININIALNPQLIAHFETHDASLY